jgi:hypothetical protein
MPHSKGKFFDGVFDVYSSFQQRQRQEHGLIVSDWQRIEAAATFLR